MEGQVLDNRYELIEKIGGGGMAVVYKARCKLLDRFVAVKILRPEFTNDEEFVKRFRIEAQSAARLSHPNIVSIYDVGHEGNTHYIVMEYIDGITLKEYISREGFLKWKQAVNIAIQICSAIEQAHRNHIVHRDIKPHNILITKDGIAKVTDFGIARAVSSSTITMAGSTIGSVHYFSPEQARGGFIDEKSDLYSLGIALYEMVTGKVPFDGDTPVAIALKHIQNQAKQPVEINKGIPKGVNDIIMKAIKKEQSQRYQTASDMLRDLYRVLKEPNGDFLVEDNTEDYPTRKIHALNEENFIQGEEQLEMYERKNKKGKKKDRYTVILAVLTSVIIMFAIGYITYKLVFPAIAPEQTDFEVQNYVGRDIDEVRAEFEEHNIDIDIKEKKVPSDKRAGTILSQNIEAGQKLKMGGYGSIEFEVSSGPELVAIPDLKLQDYRTAEEDLKKLGLKIKQAEEFSDTVASGLVIRTDPDFDEKVRPGTTVTIFKSKGPELAQVEVPDITSMTRDEAQKLLADANLKIGKIIPEDVVNIVDKVTKQYPPAFAMVDEGTAVDIYFEEQMEEPGKEENGEQDSNDQNLGRKIISDKINLDNPDGFGDRIKILVEATPSDTNKVETIINEIRSKDSFPVTINVPVPENGMTKIRVFLDNRFYTEYYRYDNQ
jgi:serine/threonine protein kinase/beta-lactam-binding protein with PASTA domain